jgi:hypothetical protein
MVLCIEPEKIYSPLGCHEIAFPSTFSHNGPRPIRAVLKTQMCSHQGRRKLLKVGGGQALRGTFPIKKGI